MKKILLLAILATSILGLKAADDPTGAIDSAYQYLRVKYYEGNWSTWAEMPEYSSDDAVVVGLGPTDRIDYHRIDEYSVSDSNVAVRELWNRNYHALHYVNRALGFINSDDNEELAEMHFLRAYYHFEMLRFFGEVPVHEIIVPINKYLDKSDLETIFASIVRDLQYSVKYLPEKSERPDGEKAKPTTGAALALLGKVYLYMASPFYNQGSQYYDSANSKLQLVINSGEYALEADFSEIWRLEHELGVESVFEIEYETESPVVVHWSSGYEALSNIDIQLNGPISSVNDTINSGWQMEMLTKSLAGAFDSEGDSIRKHGTLLADWQLRSLDVTFNTNNVETYTGYYTAKRASWKYLNPFAGMWSYPTNERMIRYADVLLMASEALNRKQNPDNATALSYVNMVRARAGLAPVNSNGDALYAAIKNERRLELADEGQRFFDLVRWGDAESTLGTLGFTTGVNEHYPIPLTVKLGSYSPFPHTGTVIESYKNNDITLYPVPSNGLLYLNNIGDTEIKNIEIHSISGERVYSATFDAPGSLIKLDLQHLGKGVYFIKMNTDDIPVCKKFVIK